MLPDYHGYNTVYHGYSPVKVVEKNKVDQKVFAELSPHLNRSTMLYRLVWVQKLGTIALLSDIQLSNAQLA